MNRTAPLLAVFVLLVAGVALPVAGSATNSAGPAGHAPQVATTPTSNGSAEAPAPGALLAGVVDVQEAEVESELEGRAFGIKVARSNSNASRAAVVAEQVEELNRRTDTLRERKRTLTEARENGSITRARYRSEMAALEARSESVRRQLDRTQATSNDLPAGLLESRGVNATAIETLRNESRNLTGREGAEIGRSIGGPGSGDGLVGDNGSSGLPGTVTNRTRLPNGSDSPGGSPGDGVFDTPTLPGSGDGDGPPTPSGGPDLPNATDNITDNVTDVVSEIVDGSDGGEGGNETDSGTESGVGTGTDGSEGSDGSGGSDDPDDADDDGILGLPIS